jgi:hypothetical protein
MFYQSYQNLAFEQHIIALSQSYPCPRCSLGVLEPFGITETFKCRDCDRAFVPVRGGRLLYPANRMGMRIAPTFWWDGLRWHCAGTTASKNQLLLIAALFMLPLLCLNGAIYFELWNDRPDWCSPLLLTVIIGLLSTQVMYLMCWDFKFLIKRRRPKTIS